jgi:hypothetical protein
MTYHHFPRRLSRELLEGYAQFFADQGLNYALTLTFGIHPHSFDKDGQMCNIMRRTVREMSGPVLGIPKRKLLGARPQDLVFVSGFYEGTDAAGCAFPHWHGAMRLDPDKEAVCREALREKFGEEHRGMASWKSSTPRSVVNIPRAKPTFDLQPLTTPVHYIEYATKKYTASNLDFTTTLDFWTEP